MSDACKWCHGTGTVPTGDPSRCPVCGDLLSPGPIGMTHLLCVEPRLAREYLVKLEAECARLREERDAKDEQIARIINGLVESGGILMGHVQRIDFDPTGANAAREMWLESVALLNGDEGPRYFPPRTPTGPRSDGCACFCHDSRYPLATRCGCCEGAWGGPLPRAPIPKEDAHRGTLPPHAGWCAKNQPHASTCEVVDCTCGRDPGRSTASDAAPQCEACEGYEATVDGPCSVCRPSAERKDKP